MAFPEDPLGLLAEIQVDGEWEKLPLYTRSPVTHQRGIRNDGATADPASVPLTINNKDGKYSPRNPMSPYYGKIGRNTPVRLTIPGGQPYMQLVDNTDRARTPDTPAVSITGDLDIRIDLAMDKWKDNGGLVEVMGKYGGAAAISWVLFIWTDGRPTLWWTADGATVNQKLSTRTPLIREGERRAFRVTLDVNNGAGGSTCRFYTARTLAGPWAEIGDPVVTAGVTSVYDSTAPVDVGAVGFLGQQDVTGRIYGAEIRDGIDGTLVAAPDFTAVAAGTTTWTDAVGATWTLDGDATIEDRHERFIGEISEWPQKWVASGADAWVPVQAAGVLRRLGRGTKPLDSALRRRIPSYKPMAYWPMEEGKDATRAYSGLPGGDSLFLTNAEWASDDSLPSSAPLPTIQSQTGANANLGASIRNLSWASLPAWSVQWVYRVPQAPANRRTFMRILSTGTVWDWYLQSGPDNTRILGLSNEGATLVDQGIATGADIFDGWIRPRFVVEQEGSNVRYTIVWANLDGSAGFYSNTVPGTSGRPTTIASPPGGFHSDLNGMAIGHISVWDASDTLAYDRAITGWSGETAAERMLRLAEEESLPLVVDSDTNPMVSAPTDRVGSQDLAPVLDLVRTAATADGGLLTEDQTALRLRYRPRSTLYSQTPALVLDYEQGQIAAPLEPVDDDTAIRNDITITREEGASARVVLASGPLSVQDPPTGVGVYNDSLTLSLATDAQAEPKAFWELHLGTWDEPRYPAVTINLHRHPELIPAVLALREGDFIRLTNMPKWVAPDDVDLMVKGLKETLLPRSWTITYDCVPAGPWRTGVVGDDVLGRADVDEGGSTLALPSSETDAQLLVHTPASGVAGALPWITSAGPAPTYPAEFPFDVRFGGETARVTACVPSAYDAFGRTVSGGWGVADCGFTWAVSQGAASDRSVTGGAGVVTLASAPDTTRFQRLVSGLGDAEVLVRMSVSQVATGAGFIPGVLLRYVDDANFYRARVHFNPGGTMTAAVTRDYSAVGSTPTLPWTYTAGAWFWVRARVTGHLVQMRVWPDAQREPAVWHKEATITTSPIVAGQVGVTASSFAGNTNTAPQLRFDDFQVVTPQLLTVERSLNGIVKAHAAGTALSLATPAYVAL
ncbi:hypothetical protein ACFZA9_11830 [Streptomyces olivaceus]|uniref:hypothetical protein n=1 Tax=Streptomyces olivaceus TaxID=47716 RepID=UPI0036EC0D9A